ncbi:MAG TPA: 1-acyl-sn-glycerol-3-phosphate acyltransferase [Candidatus Paceibacterota bacterium]|nr:1-acyl-sn-glycerol-3-phosphate acyltransferase [Candidatus Paceibacterota bacterium]
MARIDGIPPSPLRRVLGGIGLYTVATAIGCAVRILEACGRVRVEGRGRALCVLARGNAIIAANHPSALETCVIPVLFWPHSLAAPRLYPWSIARRDLFAPFFAGLFRCIAIEPGHGAVKANRIACRAMGAALECRDVLVIYPEGTRTCGSTGRECRNARVIAPFASDIVVRLARMHGSVIVPVYVDFGEVREKLSFLSCLRRVLFQERLVISFGEPYALSGASSRIQDHQWMLRELMFSA